jgi:7-carboxy-7-deazaguanine synthase
MIPADIDSTLQLPVMEHFYTVQGEGFHSGRSAYFIRLSGCDVGCVWCDVKDSWDIHSKQLMKLDILINHVQLTKTNYVVITGGEPLMHDLTMLTELLRLKNIELGIETSGTYPLLGYVDWYCFSPKKFKQPIDEAYTLANELKIIVNHPSDFEWAEQHAAKVTSSCRLYLQPEWTKQERFLPMIIDYVKENPKWQISLQTHKFMNIP